MQKIHRRKN